MIPTVTLSELDNTTGSSSSNNNSNTSLLHMMENITLDDKKDDLFATRPNQIHRNISLDHILNKNTTNNNTTTNTNNNSEDEMSVPDIPRSISVPTDDENDNDTEGVSINMGGMDANIFKMVQKTPLMSAAHTTTANISSNNNNNGLSIPFYNKVDNTLHTQGLPTITLSGKGFTTSGSKASIPTFSTISTNNTAGGGITTPPGALTASPTQQRSGTESPQNPPTLASLLSSPIGDSPDLTGSSSPFTSSPFSITAAPTTPPGTFTSLASAKSTVTFATTTTPGSISHDIPPIQIPQQPQQPQSKLFVRMGGTRTIQGRSQKTPQMQPLMLSPTPLQQPAQPPSQQQQQSQQGGGGGQQPQQGGGGGQQSQQSQQPQGGSSGPQHRRG